MPLPADSKNLGSIGEKIARRYLENKGYRILDKNYSTSIVSGPKTGEIDIICQKEGVISFVEVKTLTQRVGDYFAPEDKVDFKKQRKIIMTAERWLSERKIPLDGQWQIDVVAVRIDADAKKAKISYFGNVGSA